MTAHFSTESVTIGEFAAAALITSENPIERVNAYHARMFEAGAYPFHSEAPAISDSLEAWHAVARLRSAIAAAETEHAYRSAARDVIDTLGLMTCLNA